MGYRGKVVEREKARRLRAQGWALADIAETLGVSKSSVSLWVRNVEFEPRPRRPGTRRARSGLPNALQRRKADEIERLRREGIERIGELSDRDLLVAGVALYAGEGAKTDGSVVFANTDPRLILFFCTWLRRCFQIDERRLRVRLYLHEGLDEEEASRFWSELTHIPLAQFIKPYRAVPDLSIRHSKHLRGCPAVRYSCSATHRAIMGLIGALFPEVTPDPG